jgi:DNA-binding NtrC family response regulator
VVPVHIPPLRERREDILPLAQHFARHFTPEGRDPPLFSPDAVENLLHQRWSGNIRELRNVIERTLALEPVPKVLDGEDLGLT